MPVLDAEVQLVFRELEIILDAAQHGRVLDPSTVERIAANSKTISAAAARLGIPAILKGTGSGVDPLLLYDLFSPPPTDTESDRDVRLECPLKWHKPGRGMIPVKKSKQPLTDWSTRHARALNLALDRCERTLAFLLFKPLFDLYVVAWEEFGVHLTAILKAHHRYSIDGKRHRGKAYSRKNA